MTKTLLFCVLFSGFLSLANGQTGNLILTHKQNNEWLDSLSTLSLSKKLLMLKDRILSDTNVFVRRSFPDRIHVAEQPGNRVYGECKPIIIINNQSEIFIDNKTANAKIVALTQLLNKNFVAEITVLKTTEPATLALYGSQGENGIIIIQLTKKKLISKFKRAKLIT